MKYISLPGLLQRLEEIKQSHPEFSPLLDQIAADAERMRQFVVTQTAVEYLNGREEIVTTLQTEEPCAHF